jgi:organic radical activating enzyme
MFTALAWSSVKKTLIEAEREELFAYITSVRLTDKSIVITTGKPVANEELKFYREKLLENVNISLSMMKGMKREKIRLH